MSAVNGRRSETDYSVPVIGNNVLRGGYAICESPCLSDVSRGQRHEWKYSNLLLFNRAGLEGWDNSVGNLEEWG